MAGDITRLHGEETLTILTNDTESLQSLRPFPLGVTRESRSPTSLAMSASVPVSAAIIEMVLRRTVTPDGVS